MTFRKFFAAGAVAAVLISSLAIDASAQGRGRGQSKDKNKGKVSAPAQTTTVVVFAPTDRTKFREYFVSHKWATEPLPPGIAMNIARGKPLPPGISKRVLPRDLVVLVPRDPTVTYYVVGDRVVAVRQGNVVDILLDIFR